jgi:hypothetical protein
MRIDLRLQNLIFQLLPFFFILHFFIHEHLHIFRKIINAATYGAKLIIPLDLSVPAEITLADCL